MKVNEIKGNKAEVLAIAHKIMTKEIKVVSHEVLEIVFDNHNWIPVDIGKGRGKHVKFYNIPKGILYIVGTYEDGKFVPKSSPFILTQRGKIEYVKRSNTATDFRIYRKYPSFGHIHWVKDFLRMGRIEASQSPTFEHVDSIVGFADKNYFAGEVIIPDTTARQYWRLISSNAKSSDFAEIYFYERESGSRINGKLIFSVAPIRDSLYDNPRHICDNDPLTYVAVEDSDTSTTNFKRWVGFDFGKPVSISKVAYIRRGDGNDICPGDYYELYYWDNNKWILHEGKKAETIYLDFNHVPANALYYIKNCSRGQQNRTFILENNQIRWY